MSLKLIILVVLASFSVQAQPNYLELSDVERIFDHNRELPGECRVKLLNYVPGQFLNVVIKKNAFFGERLGLQLREKFHFFKRTESGVTYRLLQHDRSPKCHFTDIFEKCPSKRTTIVMSVDVSEKITRLRVREDHLVDDEFVKNLTDFACN